MGIGDSIKNAAENAMKDLGGTAEPHDDAHVPEPGAPDEEIKVHSTISEASNTMDAAEDERPSDEPPGGDEPGRPAPGSKSEAGTGGNVLPAEGDEGTPGASATAGGQGQSGADQSGTGQSGEGLASPPGHVPGPGGLPAPEPDVMRADPTEGDTDPSTSMGRG